MQHLIVLQHLVGIACASRTRVVTATRACTPSEVPWRGVGLDCLRRHLAGRQRSCPVRGLAPNRDVPAVGPTASLRCPAAQFASEYTRHAVACGHPRPTRARIILSECRVRCCLKVARTSHGGTCPAYHWCRPSQCGNSASAARGPHFHRAPCLRHLQHVACDGTPDARRADGKGSSFTRAVAASTFASTTLIWQARR